MLDSTLIFSTHFGIMRIGVKVKENEPFLDQLIAAVRRSSTAYVRNLIVQECAYFYFLRDSNNNKIGLIKVELTDVLTTKLHG